MIKKSLIVFIILILVFFNSCSNKINEEISVANDEQIVTEDNFVAASSIEILQSTTDQMANNNYDLLEKYMKSGDYFVLPKGTRIKILQTRDNKYSRCLVLDGRYAAKEFWTFTMSFKYGANIPFDLIIQSGDPKRQ